MTISEDESLLNSSSDEENIVKSPFSDNSVTAIISDESSENEVENEEEDEEEKISQKPRAFTDKENKGIKLKGDDNDMEEEDDMEEDEEKVCNSY